MGWRRRGRGRFGLAVAGLAVLAAAAGGIAVVVPGAAGSGEVDCERIAARSAERARHLTGHGPLVAVVGDSYAQGLKLDRPAESWPSRLPGRLRVDGFAGSGFSRRASPCAGQAYADRLPAVLAGDPDLVILEGGLNEFDVPTAAVEAGLDRALDALTGRQVLVVGPVAAPARAGQVSRVDRALAVVAARHRVPYLDLTGLDLAYLPDRLHLTPAGHRAFGDAVAAAVGPLLMPGSA